MPSMGRQKLAGPGLKTAAEMMDKNHLESHSFTAAIIARSSTSLNLAYADKVGLHESLCSIGYLHLLPHLYDLAYHPLYWCSSCFWMRTMIAQRLCGSCEKHARVDSRSNLYAKYQRHCLCFYSDLSETSVNCLLTLVSHLKFFLLRAQSLRFDCFQLSAYAFFRFCSFFFGV